MKGVKELVEFLMRPDIEGGYSNDPLDPGGETKWGISKRAFPLEDIKGLTVERTIQLYDANYWKKMKGDDLPFPIAFFVTSCAVNQGVQAASVMLQKALKVEVDGQIGPFTVKRANDVWKDALWDLAALRAERYLSMDNNTEERYEKGWVKRMLKELRYAVTA